MDEQDPTTAPASTREFVRAALEEHSRWLRTVLLARGVDPSELDDVFQEVAAAAVDGVDRLNDRQRVGPWLYRIAALSALEHRRKSGRRRRRLRAVAEDPPRAEPCDPLDWLIAREQEQLVRDAVRRLPSRDAEVLMLKHAEGWSYRQLATRLGVSEEAVQSRLHRARQRLRVELSRTGLAPVR